MSERPKRIKPLPVKRAHAPAFTPHQMAIIRDIAHAEAAKAIAAFRRQIGQQPVRRKGGCA